MTTNPSQPRQRNGEFGPIERDEQPVRLEEDMAWPEDEPVEVVGSADGTPDDFDDEIRPGADDGEPVPWEDESPEDDEWNWDVTRVTPTERDRDGNGRDDVADAQRQRTWATFRRRMLMNAGRDAVKQTGKIADELEDGLNPDLP